MKVIKHGNASKKVVCFHCGAELEYEGSDIIYNGDYQTSQYTNGYIICPYCGDRVYVMGIMPYINWSQLNHIEYESREVEELK